MDTEQKEIILDPVWITGLPIPPSSNAQYKPFRNSRTGKLSFKSVPELISFKKETSLLIRRNVTQYITNVRRLQSWIENGIYLEVRVTLFIEKKTMYTSKGVMRMWDISNRIKSLHDALAETLGIDDSLFCKVTAEKRLVHSNQIEQVVIEIVPYFLES